ncbi:MAG: sugar phosphate nucleotidyltransferase, partial [Planctomycetota bacterium]
MTYCRSGGTKSPSRLSVDWIMAGGSGTRFWPASRRLNPKQLLQLAGNRTMIQSTLNRLGDLVPPDRQYVITNQTLVDPVAAQLPDLPS